MNEIRVGAALSYVIIAINALVGIAYTPFMLRMLGQSEYGLYSLVASVIAYLTILDLGFENTIIRYTSKFRTEGKLQEQYEMFGMFFRVYIIIGLIAFILGLILSFNVGALFYKTMSSDELRKMKVMFILMSINLAFTFPLSIFGSIIAAYEKFIFQKLVILVRVVLNPIVFIIVLFFGYKAIALVVITTLFNILTLSVNCWYCLKKLNIKIYFTNFNWSFLKEVSIFSLWIFVGTIMDRIYWNTGQFILGIFKGADSVAVYSVAIQLKQMFFLFSTAIAGVLLPKVTGMITSKVENVEISNLFIKTGRVQFLIMSFILSAFIAIGRQFVNLWAGPEYDMAYFIALLFFVSSLIPLIQNVGITILIARDQMKFRSLLYLLISVSSIFIAIPLAKEYGGIGCALATSMALFFGNVLIMNIYYHKKVHIDMLKFWTEIGKMTIVPLMFSIIGLFVFRKFGVNSISLFIKYAIIFAILYILAVWRIGMNKYEKETVKSIINNIYTRLLR
ncbi:flippase [Porphyromonadaceae bacterium]